MTAVTATSADSTMSPPRTHTEATASPRPAAGIGSRGPAGQLSDVSGGTDLAKLAAVSWSAAFGAVTLPGTGGARIPSAYGFDPADPPPVAALCERVLSDRRLVVVADASADPGPAGGGAGTVRFFAGAPIITGAGDLLGVLWVADHAARPSGEAHPGELLVALAKTWAAGAELEVTRAQYQSALDLAGDAAFRCGTDGVLTWVSPSWETMTGHAVEAMLGRPLTQFLLGDLGDTINEVISGAGDGSVRRIECSLLTADGPGVPVELAMSGFSVDEGGVRGLIGVAVDIAERQQRELEARHGQKLESLGRLSAGIAHEINTPIQFVGDNTRFLASAYEDMLNLILVYRECMSLTEGETPWDQRLDRVADAERIADVDYLAAEVPDAVKQSLEGIERVASLVRAMKSFSYKDSHDRSYADLNEALTTTLTVARNEVKYVADVRLDLGELPDVLCHAGDLNQVFLNLLVNAADALQAKEERGEITIATRVDGPMAVISIADNGCGIPEHLQQVIFEPFFTTKDVGKGTGQGLALTRAVIDKHGGTVEVHSTPGVGTEFVLRLPVDGKRPGPA